MSEETLAALEQAIPYISTISPLYLPYISLLSPLYLPYISPISPFYLPYISPPAGAPVSAEVSVTTDAGVSWSSPGAVFTRYDASAAAELASVSPRASGMAERRLLTVRGANLAPTPDLACSFAGVAVTPATFIASDRLRCEAPAASAISTTELRIGLDQEHWSALAVPFTFYDASRPPAVTTIDGPSFGGNAFGPLSGHAAMQLRGDNFAPTEALACRYALERGTTDGAGGTAPNPAYLPATFVSVHEVLCAAPASSLPRSTEVSAST